ncbi:MAG: hypothetical protein D3922_13685, partial [Candidatus Electrothrix sp. AR1]|nr:hypothetical protein [Candidatus Electrothrix sp. AR1]
MKTRMKKNMKTSRCFFNKALNPVRMAPLLAALLSLLFAGTAQSGPLQLQATFDNDTVYTE